MQNNLPVQFLMPKP